MRLYLETDRALVRVALAQACSALAGRDLPPGRMETVELVLAEILNNIVEHAFPPDARGRIEMALDVDGKMLRCEIRDNGREMPGGMLPAGRLPPADGPTESLPEGGFGWFLIRSLVEGLTYGRVGAENVLSFAIPLASCPDSP